MSARRSTQAQARHRARRLNRGEHPCPQDQPAFNIALFFSLSLLWALAHAQAYPSAQWPKTDFTKRSVEMSEILSGGPPKDGIPAIDEPRFTTGARASEWLDPREPVIVVQLNDTAKAYPLQILMWHEIVNDIIDHQPIAVTFCPLCNASIVFNRKLDDKVLDFGTTGKLRKSDMVMYDRQTESWWQQFSGKGIVGEFVNRTLDRVPAQIVAFEDFHKSHPDGRVLSRETGHRRDYGRNPYRGYDSIEDQPFLFFDPVDKRLPPMERVLNVSIGELHKLYRFSTLETSPVINDEVSGEPIVVLARDGTLSPLDQPLISASKTIPSANAYLRMVGGRALTFELRDNHSKICKPARLGTCSARRSMDRSRARDCRRPPAASTSPSLGSRSIPIQRFSNPEPAGHCRSRQRPSALKWKARSAASDPGFRMLAALKALLTNAEKTTAASPALHSAQLAARRPVARHGARRSGGCAHRATNSHADHREELRAWARRDPLIARERRARLGFGDFVVRVHQHRQRPLQSRAKDRFG